MTSCLAMAPGYGMPDEWRSLVSSWQSGTSIMSLPDCCKTRNTLSNDNNAPVVDTPGNRTYNQLVI